jgi:rRNA-processing protein FCF1
MALFFFSFYIMYNLVNFEAILYMILIDTNILINYIYQGRIILIKKLSHLVNPNK